MLYSLLEILVVLQSGVHGDEASGGGATGAVTAPGGPGAAAPSGGGMMQFVMMGAVIFIFYFLIIRPQQKRQKEHDALLKTIKKGDIVRTSGGIRGEVFEINERDATLIIADKVKINILRSQLAGPDVDPATASAKATEAAKPVEKGT